MDKEGGGDMMAVVRGILALPLALQGLHVHAQASAARMLTEAPAEVHVRPLVVARLVAKAGEQPVPQGRKIGMTQRQQGEAAGSMAGMAALGAAGSAQAVSTVGVMVPMYLALGIYNQSVDSRDAALGQALRGADVPAMLLKSANALLSGGPTAAASPVSLEFLVINYGLRDDFVPSLDNMVCVAMQVDMVLSTAAEELYRDRITLGSGEPVEDVPPPACTSRSRLAANNGQLLHQVLRDYADTFAAIAARRLPVLPWK